MARNQDRVELPRTEAACLEALRSGAGIKSRVAVGAGVTLGAANRALQRLAGKGLAISSSTRPGGATRWEPTELGRHATIVAVDSGRRRGRPPANSVRAGSSSERLLQQLDQPKRLIELAVEVGITKQRAHQNIVRLLALGLVRSADPERPTWIVARVGDPTILLRRQEQRVISAFPDAVATTAGSLARRLRLPTVAVDRSIEVLISLGLVEKSGEDPSDTHFKPTRAGAEHFQRNPSARRAEPPAPPALPVRSDRIRTVLDYLAANGPTRTIRIGENLDIERNSINALMQYLKRLGLVRKAGASHDAPHELTAEGRRVRDKMVSRVG
jgi:DNA-binding IclR family transcriptional regulator